MNMQAPKDVFDQIRELELAINKSKIRLMGPSIDGVTVQLLQNQVVILESIVSIMRRLMSCANTS